ncbi:hypothetical protein G7Y89_g6302 [Cudoniella acicularis]|uniref:Uncharacterized protein n=1 Tax=Cudoniella acicularis TaxID=354080 RepID=A0A8H4W351_9HELO|nr:hypothetical protein G7Y89_g6302 [Cudoniella acicularis]
MSATMESVRVCLALGDVRDDDLRLATCNLQVGTVSDPIDKTPEALDDPPWLNTLHQSIIAASVGSLPLATGVSLLKEDFAAGRTKIDHKASRNNLSTVGMQSQRPARKTSGGST